jgi:asparagine synthase (glutamine-hydrolysing)
MCGIAGIVAPALPAPERAARGGSMLRAVAHRGPDGTGSYEQGAAGVWLGHRRLAIIDVGGGAQPMFNEDGTVAVVFNGCIYNYRELRADLVARGHAFRTHSDTEVIVHGYEEWGDRAVERFNGMWAFAIWDDKARRLFCSRDRLGEKPLYWTWTGSALAFASEIKALLASRLVAAEADPRGLRQYLTFQLCLGEQTLFKGISRLPPGSNLIWQQGSPPRVAKYWDVAFDIEEGATEEAFRERLESLLSDSVRLRLRADVPLGAHLSGGLDSSVVIALARRHLGDAPLSAFTGAFAEGPAYDERPWSRAMARSVSAKPHEVVLSSRDFVDAFPTIVWHMDEPAAGPGVFPQFGVSRLASEKVKVVLGGQGGDELFIGYARYLVAYLEECLKGAIQETADRGNYVATLATIIPSLPTLQNYVPMLRGFWQQDLFGPPARRYFRLMDRFADVGRLLSPDFAVDRDTIFHDFVSIFDASNAASMINRILYFDLKTHLQALLHVEDRTSMAFGLESRVPLLDHRLVEFMATVPPTIKFRHGKLKHLFLEAVGDLVPPAIRQRKDKMGFPVPLSEWMKGPLREFVRDVLGSSRARARGIFDTDALMQQIDDEASFGRIAWGALNLEVWHREFIDADGRAASPRS